MTAPVTVWTPEMLAKARRMRAEGLDYGQIGERLGRSRKAVGMALRKNAFPPIHAKSDAAPARERPCLRCQRTMRSTGPHHRMCDPCRSGNGLSDQMQVMGNT